MHLDQLNTFIVVCKMGSYHKASGMLFLSQPTITHRINQLEAELNVTLLIRGRKGIQLTPEGKIFLKHAQMVVASMAEGIGALEYYKNKMTKRLSIACTRTYSAYMVPQIMNIFLKLYPDIEVSLHAISTSPAIAGLIDNKYQFAFSRYSVNHPDLEFLLLREEQIYVAMPTVHKLASKDKISIYDVQEEPLILPIKGTQSREFLEIGLNKYPIPYKVRYETNDIELLKHLVIKGAGVSFFDTACLKNEIISGQLIVRLIEENPFPLRPTFLVYKKENITSLMQLYIKSISDSWNEEEVGY